MTLFKKLIYFLTFLNFFVFHLSSQELNVDWGPEIEGSEDYYYWSLGWEGEHFYALKNNKSTTFLEKFTKDMQILSSTDLGMNMVLNHYQNGAYDEFVFKDGKLYIMGFDEKYFLHVFNTDGIELNKFDLPSHDYDGVVKGESPDKSKMPITFFTWDEEKKKIELQIAYFFLEDSTKLINSKITLDIPYNYVHMGRQWVDKLGNIYLILYMMENKHLNDVDQMFVILDKNGNLKSLQEFKKDEYYFDHLNMLALDEEVLISGMYYTKNKKGKKSYLGFFLSEFNGRKLKYSKFSTYNFGREFLSKYGNNKPSNGALYFIGSYEMNIVPSESGGYLIGENYLSEPNSNYNELLVFNYSETGVLTDFNLVPKNQICTSLKDRLYAGYYAFVEKGKLNLIYTDNIKNLEVKYPYQAKSMTNPTNKKSVSMHYSLDKKSNIQRKVFLQNSELDGFFISSSVHKENGVTVIGMKSGKKMKYGLLRSRFN